MNETPEKSRLAWIEPEVADLAVNETAASPGRGFDAGAYPDCTRS